MRDAFDDLERELRRAVRARRRRRVRRTLTLAVAAVLALAGVAASQITRAPDVEHEVGVKPRKSEVDRVLFEAVKASMRRPECQPAEDVAPPQVAQRPLVRQITTVLPALATPVPGADHQQAVELLDGSSTTGTIVSQSVRTLEFPGGLRLTVFVLDDGRVPEQDPEACAAARRERAAELASGELLAAVERRILKAGLPLVGRQSLFMSLIGPGEPGPLTTGFLTVPKLRTGIVKRFGLGATRRYEGIVSSPRVTEVRVDRAHGRTLRVRVQDGFYVFALERGSGVARVIELSASGERVRSFRLPR
jgi:hypothetical protein